MSDVVRVRIAPSPTGKLHIGTARTALFNFLFAKKHEGKFLVRMEDTDVERSTDDYARDILDGLLWLGMPWDEGPEIGGPFEPYNQKDRGHIYEKFIDQLLTDRKAYRCFCTPEELEKERQEQQARGEAPKYSGKCCSLSEADIQANLEAKKPFVIRFSTPPQKVVLEDMIKGKVEFDSATFGDFVIVRSNGSPLFILTNVIDDSMMQITHVLRGEDHLVNTGKQILLAEALNILPPQFGHFPMILNTDRSKMSKRKNPVSISDDYKAKGFLPEAIINFVALLGWSSGDDREIFSMHELIEEFQIERVGKSPSVFDHEKLLWMNGYYLRHLDVGDLASRAQSFITNKEIFRQSIDNPEYFLQVMSLIQDRLKTLAETEELIEFFYLEPQYEPELLIAKKSTKENAQKSLTVAATALEAMNELTLEATEVTLRKAARDNDLKDGELLWTVRVALTGRDASPGVFEMLTVLGKKKSLERIKKAKLLLAS